MELNIKENGYFGNMAGFFFKKKGGGRERKKERKKKIATATKAKGYVVKPYEGQQAYPGTCASLLTRRPAGLH